MKKLIFIFLLIVLSSCKENMQVKVGGDEGKITKAVAVLEPLNNSGVHGLVYFYQKEGLVEVVADVYGLSRGNHGFHIHKYGDLRSLDGKDLDGHFNPTNEKHGGLKGKERHLGDLGNIYAMNDTTAHYDQDAFNISISGKYSILGRSIVIHQGEDDLKSQPSGNSGMKVAAGVIGIMNESIK